MKIRALAIAMLLTLPVVAAACGGADDTNSGDRPTADEIKEGFASQLPDTGLGNTDSVLDCVGTGLEKSELPNGVLRSIASGDEKTEIDADNEEKYTKIVTDVVTKCTTEAIGDITGTTVAGG